MKKFFTLIIALVAMVSGAWADDRTPINYIEATAEPDPAAIAILGVSTNTMPKITVTKGAPVRFSYSRWCKKHFDDWEVPDGEFTPGIWRFQMGVRIEDESEYAFGEPLGLYIVNGRKFLIK